MMTSWKGWARGLCSTKAGAALLLSVVAAACDSGSDSGGGSGVTCGAGTEEKDGECVLAEADDGPDGSNNGAANNGGTTGGGTALSCGAGTVEASGACIPDPDKTVTCGDGTVAVDGKCTVAPVQPDITGLTVTHLALSSRGVSLRDSDTVSQYYPIEVAVGLTYKGDAAKIPVTINLTQPDPANPGPGCSLGGFQLDHPGGATATEAIGTFKGYVPRTCLGDGETERVVTPLVVIDPNRALNAVDEDSVSRAIPFDVSNTKDADLGKCRREVEGSVVNTCALKLKVKKSPGLDFELAAVKAESSIVVVDKCGDVAPRTLSVNDWTALLNDANASTVDIERPATYRCNSAIVPEFKVKTKKDAMGKDVPDLDAYGNKQFVLDANGNPVVGTVDINGTTYPSYLYGDSDLGLNVTVITHGEPSSDAKSADDANATLAGKPDPVAHNALKDHNLEIRYKFRPTTSSNDSDWQPLYLHNKGEQAKADEATTSGQDQGTAEETTIVPATPSYYTHGLFLENDCGEKNKATCNANVIPRDDVVYGKWKGVSDFTVRACIVPVDSSGNDDNALDKLPDNNCKDTVIKVVRRPSTGSTKAASAYSFNKDWSNTQGNTGTVALVTELYTHNTLNTGGAYSDNQGRMYIQSSLIGTLDIIRAWGKVQGLVSVVGSGYDYGVSVFGQKVWGEAKEIPEYHWEKDWNYSREASWGFTLWAGVIPVRVSFRISGSVGLVLNFDIVAVKDGADAGDVADADGQPADDGGDDADVLAKFPGAKVVGLASASATPYASLVATLSAGIDVGVARAGVAGQLTLLSLRTPLTGYLGWGVLNLSSPFTMRAGVWADFKLVLTVLQGRLYLYAEHWAIWGCGSWCVTSGYRTFWDYTIASWAGWSWNQTLWSSPFYNYDVNL